MSTIGTKYHDHILTILFDRGRSNALDSILLKSLIAKLQEAAADATIEGVILQGKADFFSAGLDLITLYDYDAEQINEFWQLFLQTIDLLASFPKPVVAAISGHSPAGGCVIALCCDYRIMASGNYVIGLNELAVGLTVPKSIFELYAFWIGYANAYRNLLEGKLLDPEEACREGLVDQVVPMEQLHTAAVRQLKKVAAFDQKIWKSCKLDFRSEIITKLHNNQEQTIDDILQQWWLPTTRTTLKTIIDSLTSKK